MKHVKIVLGLAIAACLLAVAAAPALAAPNWEEEVGGKFKIVEKALSPATQGSLKLEDSNTKVGVVRIECEVESAGKVGPKAEDKIETATTKNCKTIKGTCEKPKAEAVHLPWNTELYFEGVEVRDRLKNSGAGLPGWKVTCTVLFIKETDTCEGETNTGMANLAADVEAKFDAKSPKAVCSQKKTETGTVEGSLVIHHPAGTEAIRVK